MSNKRTTKWTQEIKDTTELADQLAYALFEDEKKYAKEFEIWRDEHGIYLDINSENEEIWNALPSGLMFWLMKKHYTLNTDSWNGNKVDINKAINDFWEEADRLTYTSYKVCHNFYEWTSVKQGDDEEEEEEEPQKELKSLNLKEAYDNLMKLAKQDDLTLKQHTELATKIIQYYALKDMMEEASDNLKEAIKDNPYVMNNIDISKLDRRVYTCTGHMEVKTSDV